MELSFESTQEFFTRALQLPACFISPWTQLTYDPFGTGLGYISEWASEKSVAEIRWLVL